MRGVRIDHNQARCILRQDVNAVQVRNRKAQRRNVGMLLPCSRGRGGSLREVGIGCPLATIDTAARHTPAAKTKRRLNRVFAHSGLGLVIARHLGNRLRTARRTRQRRFDGTPDKVMHRPAVAKTDFVFRRVSVDIDERGIHVEVQDIGRMPAVKQHIAVGLAHGTYANAIPNGAAVQKKMLQVGLAAGKDRPGDPAANLHAARCVLEV